MDVQMPVMDGIEATRRLRQMPAFATLPIVALTAGAFKSQQDAVHAAGMTHFISKPFDVPSTIAMILRLTERSRATTAQHREPPAKDDAAEQAPEAGAQPVIDVTKGMEIWTDRASYHRYLRLFVEDYQDFVPSMRQHLQQANLPAAQALAHKLVGVASNMALPQTYHAAAELDRRLNTASDPAPYLAILQGALQRALASIHQQLSTPLQ